MLLVDDNATVRNAVCSLFDSHPHFEVCGEADHGREAVEKAPNLRPDLILLNLPMPVMNGLEAAPLLLEILPNVWLILFTAHDGAEVTRLSRAAGIHAVIPKSKASTHLVAQAEALVAHASSTSSTRNAPAVARKGCTQTVEVLMLPVSGMLISIPPEPMLEHAIRHRA